jgi:hypothetical protein
LLLPAAGLTALAALGVAVYWWSLPGLRRALPWSASDIHEHRWEEGGELAQDYTYCLRARLTREAFDCYVTDLGLTSPPRWSGSGDPRLPHVGCAAPWWREPARDEDRHADLGASTCWTVAHYLDGQVFVTAGCL